MTKGTDRSKKRTEAHSSREHIYRKHIQPIHCDRCFEVFETDHSRTQHLRASSTCDAGAEKPFDGVTHVQEKRLRNRKKDPFCRTRVEMWRAVFLIVFPDHEGEIPSPCKSLAIGSFLRVSALKLK